MKINKTITFSSLLLLPSFSFAIGDVDPSNDVIMALLGKLFGPVGFMLGEYAGNTILDKTMALFNSSVLTIGLIVFSYVSIVSVLAGSNDIRNETMWSSLLTPAKSAIGIMLLVPSAGTGYSVIQAMVMWIIVQGVGAGNALWENLIRSLDQGFSLTADTSYLVNQIKEKANGKAFKREMLKAATCYAGIRHFHLMKNDDSIVSSELSLKYGNDIDLYTLPVKDESVPDSVNPVFKYTTRLVIGSQNHPNPLLRNFCGAFDIYTEVSRFGDDPLNKVGNLQGISRAIHARKITALEAAFSAYQSVANRIARDKKIKNSLQNRDDAPFLKLKNATYNFIEVYAGIMSTSVLPQSGQADFNVDLAIKQGWGYAANYINKFVTSGTPQKLFKTALSDFPEPDKSTIPSSAVLTDSLYELSLDEQEMMKLYMKAAELYFISDTGAKQFTSPIDTQNKNIEGGFLVQIFFTLLGGIDKEFDNLLNINQNDFPLTAIANIGKNLMSGAETAWIITIASASLFSLASGYCSAISPKKYLFYTLAICLGFGLANMMLMMWGVGATLGIYMPMIPYLVFTTAIIGWLFSVVETIFAAPLLALGFSAPSHSELGKANGGLEILANVVFKPSLLIIGFVFSLKLLQGAVLLLNSTFLTAVKALPIRSTETTLLRLDSLLLLFLYAGIVAVFTSKCSEFITIPANKIMEYMGGTASTDDTSAVLQETEQRAQQGIETVTGIFKSASQSAQNQMLKKDDEKKGGKKGGNKGGGGGGKK